MKSKKCECIRGLESWQPSCGLEIDHTGSHKWTGPSLDEEIRTIEEELKKAGIPNTLRETNQ